MFRYDKNRVQTHSEPTYRAQKPSDMPQTSLKHYLNDNPTLWQMLAITDVISTTTTLTLNVLFLNNKVDILPALFHVSHSSIITNFAKGRSPYSQEHHPSPLHFQRKQARINLEYDNCSEEDFVMRNRHEYSSHEVEINGRGAAMNYSASSSPPAPHTH
jgi:hypothetical protein